MPPRYDTRLYADEALPYDLKESLVGMLKTVIDQ
jgi:hypothetical protein